MKLSVLLIAALAVAVIGVMAQEQQGHNGPVQNHHNRPQHRGADPFGRPQKRPFTCLFFPGEGLDWPALDIEEKDRAKHPAFVKESFPDYWGHDVAREVKHGQRCEKVFFYDTDTTYRTWREKSLAFEFDNAIKHIKPHVIFAHGSANLVLSSCIKRRMPSCDEIGKKRDWYGIQAPLRGTDVAKVMPRLCPILTADPVFGAGVDCVHRNDSRGQPTKPAVYDIAASWAGLRHSEIPPWVATVATERMRGSMCGVIPTDYSKPDRVSERTAFGAFAKAMSYRKSKYQKDWQSKNHPSTRVPTHGNDGIVPLSSCKLAGNKRYEKVPTAKFYIVDGNHDFGTCSNGQVDLSGSREPCSWMANMVMKTRKSKGLPFRFAEEESESEDEDETEAEAEDEAEAEAEEETEEEAEDEAEAEDEDEAEAEAEEADTEESDQ